MTSKIVICRLHGRSKLFWAGEPIFSYKMPLWQDFSVIYIRAETLKEKNIEGILIQEGKCDLCGERG